MDKFEKLAMQFECAGKLMTVPDYVETMAAMQDSNIPGPVRVGRMMALVGKCMRQMPEEMKMIVSLENDLTLEQVENLGEKELSRMMMHALGGGMASFFDSSSVQDAPA